MKKHTVKVQVVSGEMTDLRKRAMEVAARVWCDQDMGDIIMDTDAATEIASIVERVISNQDGTFR